MRAAWVLVQDVVAALLGQFASGDLAAVSERELARRAGVSQATLWPPLNGELWPRVDTLMWVAQAADVIFGVL